jgi:putative chitinase
MTLDQLLKIMPFAGRQRAALFLVPLNATMQEFEINTPARKAAFLAQVGHESGQLRYVRELASGKAYEGRRDLGNINPGDGVRFKGRGLIQVTGRANYDACGRALGLDLVNHPELLEQPTNACRSAGWFWDRNHLNWLADDGDQVKITRRINGGTNGLEDRLALFTVAQRTLKVTEIA